MNKAEKWFKKNYPHIKDGGLISSKIIGEVMQQYADEVSREFAKYLDKINKNVSTYPYGSFEGLFNEWKSKKEQP